MRGVKGRNLCKVYSQPSVENIYILVENYRFTYIGYLKKKKKKPEHSNESQNSL